MQNVSRLGLSIVTLFSMILIGCTSTSTGPRNEPITPGKDSAPTHRPSADSIIDATPKVEAVTRAGNRSPYMVAGIQYSLLPTGAGYKESGGASWYGAKFHGRNTSNGEVYNQYAMTAAHKTLPIPSYVRVTNKANGKQVIVRVNDRGPFHPGRIIDLSYAAAIKLDYVDKGVAQVEVEYIDPVAWERQQLALAQQRRAESTPLKPSVSASPEQPFIQVAATSNRNNANNLAVRLRAAVDDPVTVSEVTTAQNQQLYRVRIGPLIDEARAKDVQQLLERQGLGSGRLVKQ
ncbi:Endolytic peptidoglycan transglycosylase RlpA [Sinobacterium norvegicum]|uniref:Endolytic peptidoglycan transglycosylase RlpA n=1 Tax=Sinobacterium norvegicum TaxID=1641715 RepID=A0ABN8EJ06_9GAMM|nr:septal ring lytic transglycosylase RlpA family protein [Sinobacterium norvegicum]CAH0992436.1 Endolytic peptidoglycan transglycosylase RlpA [Sinobacterium norvegicum]